MTTSRKPRSSATGRATMADVARLAGVTAMTVSRALRQPDRVSEPVRARIQSAAAELGYVPNRAASALAAARSYNVAVLIPSLTNLVFADTISAIDAVLTPAGYQILIGITGYQPAEEARLLRAYLAFRPDGFLITGDDRLPESSALLAALECPVVSMMDQDGSPEGYSVGFSQSAAGARVARYLIERGYRRIGFVAAQLDRRTLARGGGFCQALADAGLYDPVRDLRVTESSSVPLGAALLDRMLEQAPDCDALFFCNDDLAHGALFQCQRRGIAVPGRLALVGFNDLPVSAWTTPRLTTIATPRAEVGRRAAVMLLSLIRGEPVRSHYDDLGFTLMARESA